MVRRKLQADGALQEIKDHKKEWEQNTVAKAMAKHPESRQRFENESGIALNPVYTPADIADIDYLEDLGYPGEFPYTRGIYPTGYRSKLWIMRQLAGFGAPKAAAERLRFLQEQGNEAPNLSPDVVTGRGYESDSNHPFVVAQRGLVGTTVDTVENLDELLKYIDLAQTHVSFAWSPSSFIDVAMIQSIAEQRGIPLEKVRCTFQNDILMCYYHLHTYLFPPVHGLRMARDVIVYCTKTMPLCSPLNMPGGTNSRASGISPGFEMALSAAGAMTYIQAVVDTGLDVDQFASRIGFLFYTALGDLFEEIAKFRAFRRMWARIMKNKFGARDPRSMQVRYAANGMGASKTRQQPLNNIIRSTLEALIGVLGGCQSLHVTPYDEALGIPTEESSLLGLRTQQIIAHESGTSNVVDPLGGSYYVEYLTNKLEEEATQQLKKIEDWGGLLEAIEKGHIQKEIRKASYREFRRLESGEKPKVGLNMFVTDNDPPYKVFTPDPKDMEIYLKKLAQIKRERDKDKVAQALAEVEAVARTNDNVMPSLVKAVRARCTKGEICDALRKVFGQWKDPDSGLL